MRSLLQLGLWRAAVLPPLLLTSPTSLVTSPGQLISGVHRTNSIVGCALCESRRGQSQSPRAAPSMPWQEGQLDPRYSSAHSMRKLNPDTMPHYVKATIQNDRREMGLGEIYDWHEFAKDAIYIPTRAGPLWVGADDPRAARFVRRREKMRRQPLQLDRKKPGPDKAKQLEDHPLREFFTTATNLSDPLSVANNLHRAGLIREYDIKHTAAKIHYAARPPIVSIMGHVDHGKTTLLDYLRHSNVAAGEVGGITQNVGAFQVNLNTAHHTPDNTSKTCTSTSNTKTSESGTARRGAVVTFIDTPGHAAFTAMREVGASANDLIILVVSAADGVQPQTREVIELAGATGTPLVVAITKIDRQPNCDHVIAELRQCDLALEQDGGDVQVVKICAKDGTGIDALLDAVLLQAEMCEISTPQPSRAELIVIESHEARKSRGLGGSATGPGCEIAAIVRCGTLRPGQVLVGGMMYGMVRQIYDEHGELVSKAEPATPVLITGFHAPPKPGTILMQVSSESHATKFHQFMREVYSVEGRRENYLQLVNAEQHGRIYNRKPDNNHVRTFSTTDFYLSCKAATFGMLQALMKMVYALPRLEGVSMEVRVTEVGGMRNHDLLITGATGHPACILIYGNCRDSATFDIPASTKVIRFDVLYHGIDELKRVLVGALPKVRHTKVLARAECLQVFRASQAGRAGNAGGMKVTKGTLVASHLTCRVLRLRAKGKAKVNGQNNTVNNNNNGEVRRVGAEAEGTANKKAAAASVNGTARAAEEELDANGVPIEKEVVYEGEIKELRRFKELVPSVEEGMECGVIMHDEFAFRPGDELQLYEVHEVSRDVDEEFAAAERRERTMRETAEAQALLEEEARQRAAQAELHHSVERTLQSINGSVDRS